MRNSPLRTARNATAGIVLALAAYLVVGQVLHRIVFPLPPPDPVTYPRVGDVFESRAEGVRQDVLEIRDGFARGRLILYPGAAGPPPHYHEGFSEFAEVRRGRLSLEIGGQILELGPGESHLIEAGVPHQPFNPTSEPVVVESDRLTFPLTFAACLVQLYAVMDAMEEVTPLQMALQMSVIDPICDTHLSEVPGPAMVAAKLLLAPAARLLGYRNYYPEYALHPPAAELD